MANATKIDYFRQLKNVPAIVLGDLPAIPESKLALTDVTTANATSAAHGFLPKLPNDVTKYLTGIGTFVSQWITSGTILYYLLGRIGVGTVTPQTTLSIVGASVTASTYGLLSIQTGTGATTDESLLLGVHDGDYSFIQAQKPGTGNRILALNPLGGKVGIGTTAPTSPLHVVGIPTYADNTAALAGGLTAGAAYRITGSNVAAWVF